MYDAAETAARVMQDLTIALEIVHGMERDYAIVSALDDMQWDAGENQSMDVRHHSSRGAHFGARAPRPSSGWDTLGTRYRAILPRSIADVASNRDRASRFVAPSQDSEQGLRARTPSRGSESRPQAVTAPNARPRSTTTPSNPHRRARARVRHPPASPAPSLGDTRAPFDHRRFGPGEPAHTGCSGRDHA